MTMLLKHVDFLFINGLYCTALFALWLACHTHPQCILTLFFLITLSDPPSLSL